ncbi:MAG: elongation factor P [Candidatus Phytoplasma cynodontis]|uniref:elongation factor P n=1 Tax='Cynodon dactylon' phytoplasma TaxID=295320 RepID=UPI001265CB30|nr:elongation factor P ['Cynodon dactylon' phytoplasma]KAB8122062.1 elongation factor P ['Cynodon dactylon' phytoplasma]WIA07522.1 MAG: elongation factor P [Candidatus Phytoplasma cynodontis]
MINTNDFKTGQTIKLNNKIYQIIEFLHVKPGKGAAFVRSKLKNLKTGEIIEHIFNAGVKIQEGFISKIKSKLSYVSGNSYFFLNMSNYEQIEVAKSKITNILNYLTENIDIDIIVDENQEILDIIVPNKISLKVIKTDNFIQNNSSKKNNNFKKATLETGLTIKVPIFILEGEDIIINTITNTYLSRNTNK